MMHVVREVQKMDILQGVEREREFPTARPKLSTACKGQGSALFARETGKLCGKGK